MSESEAKCMNDGLSKSRFCLGLQCPKMLWMEKYAEDRGREIDNSLIFENGHRVGALAQSWYGDYVEVELDRDNKPKMIAETEEYLKEGHVNICEASFGYDGLFCMVDILHKNEDGSFDMIEVKSATYRKEINLWDIAFQYYVLKKSGLNLRKAYCMYINKEYELHGALDKKAFFALENCTDSAITLQGDVIKKIEKVREILLSETEPDIDLGSQCFNPYECRFIDYCYGNEDTDAPDPNDITSINNPNRETVRSFTEKLSYPLAFLRIETYNNPIPTFEGMRPYKPIPFRYTLLIQRESGGEIEFREYMPEIEEGVRPDSRRGLAESLCEDIPEDACIVTCARGSEWYDRDVEARTINNLAWSFRDLKRSLDSIKDRCIDLSDAFGEGCYYVPGPVSEDKKEVETAFIYLHEKPENERAEIINLWTEHGRQSVETLFNVTETLLDRE